MKKIITLILLLCSNYLNAQITLTNQFLYASSDTDVVRNIDLGWDNNLLVARSHYITAFSAGWTARFSRIPLNGFAFTNFNLGSTGKDLGEVMKSGHNGFVYLAGHFTGTVNFSNAGWFFTNRTSSNGTGVFIAKLDTTAIPICTQVETIIPDNSSSRVTLTDMETDASGNFYLVGNFKGSITFSGGVAGGSKTSGSEGSCFFAKYNSSGVCQWVKQLDLTVFPGSGRYISLNNIDLDDSGNVYVVGKLDRNINLSPTVTSIGFYGSTFVGKYDNNGTYVSNIRIPDGVNLGEGYDIKVKDGFVYITGIYGWNNADFDPGPGTAILPDAGFAGNAYVAKYTTNLEYVWAKNTNSTDAEKGMRLAVNDAGEIFAIGQYNVAVGFDMPGATPDTTISTTGGFDIYLVKYTSAGDVAYLANVGGSGNVFATGLALTPAGDSLMMSGYFSGVANLEVDGGTSSFTSAGAYDGFIGIYTFPAPLGVSVSSLEGELNEQDQTHLKWESYREENNKGFHIEKSTNGMTFTKIGFVPSQYKNGSGTNTLQYTFVENNNYWGGSIYYRFIQEDFNGKQQVSNIVKLNPKKSHVNIKCYPNPASQYIWIDQLPLLSEIRISNAMGQSVWSSKAQSTLQYIDVATFPNGIYWISILQNGQTLTTQKIVVKK